MAGDGGNIEIDEPLRHNRYRFENAKLRGQLQRTEEVAARTVILAREADHRIKNSLQIAASVMRLQAASEQSPDARRVLEGAASRVMSIGLIHDALQHCGGEDRTDVGAMLERLCGSLRAIGGNADRIAIEVDAAKFEAPTSFARPLLLMVNELVINALRHAFPGDRTGFVRVNATQVMQDYFVTVTDDGIGLPANYALGHGYGLSLARAMCQQIGGSLTFESAGGSIVTMLAPVPRF